MKKYIVKPMEQGLSLLEFLSRILVISKNKAKDLLDQRVVFVNGQRVWMARHTLRSGDEVESHSDAQGAAETPRYSILFRDKHLVIVNKPPGILSTGPNSLETVLRKDLGEKDLEAVHRLDQDTSGCLIFAINRAAKDLMIPLFKGREITKVYHAIAKGLIPTDIHEIRVSIEGEPSTTRMEILDQNKVAAHVKMIPETGRTHQIRKHLLAIRHPLVGDKQYIYRELDHALYREAPRQMLHSSGLIFNHPVTGAVLRIKAPLPSDFNRYLRLLKLH